MAAAPGQDALHSSAHGRLATQAGLLALAIWSLSVALVRGLSESVGALTSAALATALGERDSGQDGPSQDRHREGLSIRRRKAIKVATVYCDLV